MAASRHDTSAEAWFEQSAHDLRAADHLLESGFFPHATVIAHLAVEKALKGAYRDQFDANPPVTHNLQYLAERLDVSVPADLRTALDLLSDASILRLYPDRAFQPGAARDADAAREHITAAHALINWITDQV